MKTWRRYTRFLYRLARVSNDLSTLASGDPTRIIRRLANKAIGRHAVRRMFLGPYRRQRTWWAA